MLIPDPISRSQAEGLPLRLLAHLGDVVFHLFQSEREITMASTAKQMHRRILARVNANHQALVLQHIADRLNEQEADLVRRARNIKPAGFRKHEQANYRQAI
jgi:23S rRNA maturation mini-RNase III